jgi:hypothetical protein
MTDAVVLIALSQLVCLGAIAYLYARLQAVSRHLPANRSSRRPVPAAAPFGQRRAPVLAASAGQDQDLAALATRMHSLGIDVPTLARRMRRTEDEVRALLHGSGVSA